MALNTDLPVCLRLRAEPGQSHAHTGDKGVTAANGSNPSVCTGPLTVLLWGSRFKPQHKAKPEANSVLLEETDLSVLELERTGRSVRKSSPSVVPLVGEPWP